MFTKLCPGFETVKSISSPQIVFGLSKRTNRFCLIFYVKRPGISENVRADVQPLSPGKDAYSIK